MLHLFNKHSRQRNTKGCMLSDKTVMTSYMIYSIWCVMMKLVCYYTYVQLLYCGGELSPCNLWNSLCGLIINFYLGKQTWAFVMWNNCICHLKETEKTRVGDPWHFGADQDPDPTPDPTTFLNDNDLIFKKCSHFFLITYPQVHHLQS